MVWRGSIDRLEQNEGPLASRAGVERNADSWDRAGANQSRVNWNADERHRSQWSLLSSDSNSANADESRTSENQHESLGGNRLDWHRFPVADLRSRLQRVSHVLVLLY